MNMEKEVLILNIDDVLPNRFQPRIKFKEENINEEDVIDDIDLLEDNLDRGEFFYLPAKALHIDSDEEYEIVSDAFDEELDAMERLALIHNFFRPDEESDFYFDINDVAKKGHSFRDYICPDTFETERDCFRFGDRCGRVVFLRDYANYIKDDMITELCDIGASMMLSLDFIPIPTDEAVREVENRLLGVETNIANWQRRQNQNNNFSAVIPFDMEVQRRESKDFLNDLTNRDQRMMFGVLTAVITADNKRQLNSYTDALFTIGRKRLCQFSTLKYQQFEGLNTVLPYGIRKIDALRTLTTESAAVFMPFRVQEVFDKGGIYCGKNAISGNMIVVNKANLMNGSSFHFGIPGSGKSFGCKDEMTQIALSTDDDILVCDPEREYGFLREFGAEIIHIAAGSDDHINAMDMVEGYSDTKNPIAQKSQFIMSLLEQLDQTRELTSIDKSIIDRCTGDAVCSKQLYREALNHPFDEPKQWEIREINEIMNQCVTGWSYFSNPRMFPQYGRQKGWERENATTDTGNEDEKIPDGFVSVTEQMELPF